MSVRAISAVWQYSPAKGTTLLVELALADFADDSGCAFPHMRTIAEKARVSERTVERAIKQLEGMGELTIASRSGGGDRLDYWRRPNLYTLTPGPGDKLTPPLATTRRKPGDTGVGNLATMVTPQGSVKEPSRNRRRLSGSALGGAGRTRADRDLPAGQVDVGA